jgi:hypothetical protein
MCYCKTGNENSLRVQKCLLFPPYENKDKNTTAGCPQTNNTTVVVAFKSVSDQKHDTDIPQWRFNFVPQFPLKKVRND